MARKDYQRYDPGTTVHFQPTRQVTHGRATTKAAWYKYIPGYLVMAPTAMVLTVIFSWLHINVLIQMFLVIGLAFAAKFYVDWKLGV